MAEGVPLRRVSVETTSGTVTITAPSTGAYFYFNTVKALHAAEVTDNQFFVEVQIDGANHLQV